MTAAKRGRTERLQIIVAADELGAIDDFGSDHECPALSSPFAQRFSRVSGTRHKVSVFKVRERREPFWLELAAITLAMAIGFSSRVEVEL
jgi:hypothetical protein